MPSAQRAHVAYRALAGVTAGFCLLLGALFIVAFLDRALFQVFARPLFDTNYWGYYMLAFAGAALIAWGGCLVGAARDPRRASGAGTATAAALILASMLRLLAWYSGEYRPADEPLRIEAGVLALVALGFVWLRPPRGDRGVTDAQSPTRPVVAGRIGVTLLCCYLAAVAVRIDGCYRADAQPRDEMPQAGPRVGETFPTFALPDVSGPRIALQDLAGRPLLLLLVPSLDWSAPTKARVLDLAAAVAGRHDVRLAVILTAAAATPRSLTFVREHHPSAYVLVDGDGLIERLGLQVAGPEGTPVAVPATFVLDAGATILLRDVRRDPRTWLDPDTILAAARLSRPP